MPKETTSTKTVKVAPANSTYIWVASTVIFALLFFLSSVLDMKVKVSFGDTTGVPGVTTSTVRTTVPSTTTAPAGGIASQVGGC